MNIPPLYREIGRDIGIVLLSLERAVWWFLHHEEMVEKAVAKFGRRKGDNKMALNWLENIKEVISKSPELIPEVKAIIADVEKTVADAEAIKTTVDPSTPAVTQ